MQMDIDTQEFVTHAQFHEFKNEFIELRKALRDLRDRYFEDQTKGPEDDPLFQDKENLILKAGQLD
jgi:hypothetical protein